MPNILKKLYRNYQEHQHPSPEPSSSNYSQDKSMESIHQLHPGEQINHPGPAQAAMSNTNVSSTTTANVTQAEQLQLPDRKSVV